MTSTNASKIDYEKWNKATLINEIKKIKKKTKYGLVWEEKPEDVVEICKKKLPVLNEVKNTEIFSDENNPINILIEGDNYHALSVLNYTHKRKIDVIYIDPPYNTGARDWKYNNNYVDQTDGFKHSKWIALMHHRLKLAKTLLKKDGVMCCTIDDFELLSLLGLFDQLNAKILGIVTIVIKPEGRNQEKYFMTTHEYAIFVSWGSPLLYKIELRTPIKQKFPETDENGKKFRWSGFHRRGPVENQHSSSRWYPIYVSDNDEISVEKKKNWTAVYPIDSNNEKKIWDYKKEKFKDILIQNPESFRVKRNKKHNSIQIRIYKQEKSKPLTYWNHPDYSPQAYGNKLLQEILGVKKRIFDFPKSIHAVSDCINIFLPNNGIVLDFFAGSGTTGHAVLQLNKQDNGNRKFILCTNNENNICTDVCYPRIKKVIRGYKKFKGEKVEGLSGNLKYFQTDFIDHKHTDQNKKKTVDRSTEMLCLKEDCFEKVIKTNNYSIFKNATQKYLGIVYNDLGINPLKKRIESLDKKFNVYIFSLDDSLREEEFESVLNKVELKSIPDGILNVYRSIFK